MKEWQIVIPMSGFGERFRRAGYTLPKPLIPVDGRPIIAHVMDLFPGEGHVHFICNADHLNNPEWNMRGILQDICPSATIRAIAPHKLGPVYAVAQIVDELNPDWPVAVSYCDYTGRWDWKGFKTFMTKTCCDGAVVCYTGFHPHMLASTRFAYCKTDGSDRVITIQEKQPYTDNPMGEWASCGTYCFRSGELLRSTCQAALARDDLSLNGEWYVSLAYRPLLEAGMDVRIFPLRQFCQWGTPEDLADWRCWANAARFGAGVQVQPELLGATLIPLAGFGRRFADAGYNTPKPLIPVNNIPMVLAARGDLPRSQTSVYALRRDMPGAEDLATQLAAQPASRCVWLDAPTDGQARTCLIALEKANLDPDAPLTIGACDNGLRYDAAAFSLLWEEERPDVVVWTARGHAGARRHPEQYGWIVLDAQGRVRRVSVKKPLEDPLHDPIVTGAFTFRRAGDFARAAKRMISADRKINGEFYVDECINDAIALGLKVMAFDVDAYLCWGTPDELKTWEYWREYFATAYF